MPTPAPSLHQCWEARRGQPGLEIHVSMHCQLVPRINIARSSRFPYFLTTLVGRSVAKAADYGNLETIERHKSGIGVIRALPRS